MARVRGKAVRAGAALASGLLAVAAVTGCGTDSGGGSGDGDGPVTVTVGVIPIADVAPLYLGIEQGFFEEEEITIEPQFADGGAAIVPAVVSGEYEFGYSNVVSLLTAAGEGVPVSVVSAGVDEATTEEEAFAGLIVAEDSPVQELSDLAGQSIAVNTLLNINQLAIQASFEKRDLPTEDINYTELPIPDMPAAVEAGQVDAAMTSEPFITIAGDTTRTVAAPYFDIEPGMAVATYFTNREFAESNPEVVERFVRAMNRSLDYAQEHQDEAREIVLDYTEIPAEVAEAMNLPVWSSTLNADSIGHTAQLMVDYGFVDETPDLDQLLAGAG